MSEVTWEQLERDGEAGVMPVYCCPLSDTFMRSVISTIITKPLSELQVPPRFQALAPVYGPIYGEAAITVDDSQAGACFQRDGVLFSPC